MDIDRYNHIKSDIINSNREKMGIGTLSEKTVHAILKDYYAFSKDDQEVAINGKIVDIYQEGKVIEIQTRAFEKMRSKLSVLLDEYEVTIVHPIPRYRYLCWISEAGNDVISKRKSPKCGTPYSLFIELYKIKSYLGNKNLKFKIVMMDVEEYRLLNGWSKDKKKGSTRYDRIPLDYVEEFDITCLCDYLQFIPYDICDEFVKDEFAKCAKIDKSLAGLVLHILYHIGVVDRIGKKANAYIYSINDKFLY